jgi:pilus assembly protein Flp/PilA
MIKHRHFRKNASGAAAAEYALVLAILGAALTFGALALGTAITDSMDEPSDCVVGTVAQGADCR